MTQDRALSILRSQVTNPPNLGFVVVRELEPSEGTRHAAQASLDEARLKHLAVYGEGVLLDLMRTGGVTVLEFDEKSDIATRFHLVTLDEAGKAVVQSHDVHGKLTRSEVLMLLGRNAKFSDAFLVLPDSEMKQIARDFGGTETALGAPDGQGYFGVPEAVRKLTTRPEEVSDLADLSSALQLWPARHSLATTIYAASPVDAIRSARDKQLRLVKESLSAKGKDVDFFYDLLDLNSIRTRGELLDRLQWLREITSFLDSRNPLDLASPTYKANVLISGVPLEIGVQQDAERFYAIMTAPGIINIWTRAGTGDFVLKGISEGE